MDTPVEIVCHNMPSSVTVESEIRDRVDKLDRLYGHLTGCRVSVEQSHRRHKTGNLYDIHIELRVPGNDLVVTHEPHRTREKFADPNLAIALRSAFRTAERRLLDYKRRQHGEVKLHDELAAGQVSQLYPAGEHGFVLTPSGSQLYFHRNSLVNRNFDRLQVGDKVHFVETVGDTGPIAAKVWRVEGDRD